MLPAYAELHCRSNFSFLTGASHPEELVQRAHELGYSALALTDECSLAGVVRAHEEALKHALHLIIGAEFRLTRPAKAPATEGTAHARLVALAQTRRGYGNLAQWITVCRRRAAKGQYLAHPGDLEGQVPNAAFLAGLPECFVLLVPEATRQGPPRFETVFAHAMWLKTWVGVHRAALALSLRHQPFDDELCDVVEQVAAATGLPIVATGDVLMHSRAPASRCKTC